MAEESVDPGVGAFAELIGAERTAMHEGRACFELTVGPQHMNPHGVVHGGVVYALVDYAMGGAMVSRLIRGERCATLEIKINYVAPAVTGTLSCDARLLDRSRRIAVLEARITDGDGRLIAVATGSFYVTNSSR
jgi:acyl-CoA thioesterase